MEESMLTNNKAVECVWFMNVETRRDEDFLYRLQIASSWFAFQMYSMADVVAFRVRN
jgi:hypothetical protein